MYEMYPDTWLVGGDRRLEADDAVRPRRRPRRQHSVLPPVLTVDRQSDVRRRRD